VTVNTFIVASAVGAASIALWVEVRFPKLGPERIMGGLVHLLATTAAAQFLVPVALASATNKLLAIFLVAIPALIYAFLTGIWIMKLARNAMGNAYR
jgi:hypothetical protein